ncbi:hypothetical protein FGIG_03182 [Fasciola gigantica]|uniref:Fibronectin type-III domain-containing protein n=1 Tax=Fasciola gigantica TaxID=46835 RepID=A0A504Y963_FASGI|nr:hypothetical protein FGIG_03182 [Fasciola gigantica]
MMGPLISALLTLLILCTSQTIPAHGTLRVILNNRPEGIAVIWGVSPNLTVSKQLVEYTDSEGRRRDVWVPADERLALLRLVRPCWLYHIRVSVFYQNGQNQTSEPLEIIRDAIPIPPTCTDLKIQEYGSGFSLSWTLPATDVPVSKINIIGYGDDGEVVQQSATYDQTTAVLTSFHLYHSYNVTMTTENSCGVSNKSEAVRLEAIKKPGTPVITSTVAGMKEITVRFQKAKTTDRVDEFYVNYTTPNGTVSLPPLRGTSENVSLTESISPCVKYEIDLWASNGVGVSGLAHTVAYAFSTKVPQKPVNLTVQEFREKTLIHWDSQSTEPVQGNEYILVDLSSGTSFTEYQNGDMSETELSHVKRCRSYQLKMRLENRCGWSSWSPELQFTLKPSVKPLRPNQVTVSGKSNNLTLKWDQADPKQMLNQYDLLMVSLVRGSVTYWIPPKSTQFVLTGLDTKATYALSLESKNACGWSDPVDMLIQIGEDGSVSLLTVTNPVRAILNRARRATRRVV